MTWLSWTSTRDSLMEHVRKSRLWSGKPSPHLAPYNPVSNLLSQWQTLSTPGPIQPRVQPTRLAPDQPPRVVPAAPAPPPPDTAPRVMPHSPTTPSLPAPHDSNCNKVAYIRHTPKDGPPPSPKGTYAMPLLSIGFPCPPQTSEPVAHRI